MRDALQHFSIKFEEVKIIPFSGDLPKITFDHHINIYYGSTTFMYNVYKRLSKPVGLFFDEQSFTMENYLKQWSKHMLNYGAELTTIRRFAGQTHDHDSLWFIRPNADDKSFSGEVKSFGDIKHWKDNISSYDNVVLSEDTKILVGVAYNIEKEWRNFVVGGKVVASSLYRENFKLKTSSENIPESMVAFAEERCGEYMPHKIFVMDIALCGGNYYIVECGCFNSTGFYKADVHKIIKEVSIGIL